MKEFLISRNWAGLRHEFLTGQPFHHIVLDNFFRPEVVEQLVAEFPDYEHSSVWNAHYNNPIENKKACNHWDKFPAMTYATLHYLCGTEFENIVAEITGKRFLADYTSDEQEYKALMNSAITFAQTYKLRPGIALTSQQVALLTSDIVWLEEQSVAMPDGSTQKALVPKLYIDRKSTRLNSSHSSVSRMPSSA